MTRRVKIPKTKCAICSTIFQPKSRKSNLCSESCRRFHKQEWHAKRYSEQRKETLKKAIEKECRFCQKKFPAVPITKVFCGKECSSKYKKPSKIDLGGIFYDKRNYRDFSYNIGTPDSLEKKEQQRKELETATELFLKEGGKINKLESIPEPKLPSVGSVYWNWETSFGVDPLGARELVDNSAISTLSEKDLLTLIKG